MTWTLLIVVIAYSGAPTVSSDMKFVDNPSCQSAKLQIVEAMKTAGVDIMKSTAVCINTIGRE